LGLVVVDVHGDPAGFGRTIVRSLLLVLDGGIFLIGLIAVLSTRLHRRIGDLAAGTFVVAKASAGQPIAIAPSTVPYGGPVFAAPGAGAPGGFAAPVAPTSFAPGWGVAQAPALPAAPTPAIPRPPASAAWNAPPGVVPPAAPPPALPAPPVPSMPPPAPAPPVPPPSAPIPATALPTTPLRTAMPEPKPAAAPAPPPVPQPESWWDTAIPADPPDGEEQP
jgi:hypothetical protein